MSTKGAEERGREDRVKLAQAWYWVHDYAPTTDHAGVAARWKDKAVEQTEFANRQISPERVRIHLVAYTYCLELAQTHLELAHHAHASEGDDHACVCELAGLLISRGTDGIEAVRTAVDAIEMGAQETVRAELGGAD